MYEALLQRFAGSLTMIGHLRTIGYFTSSANPKHQIHGLATQQCLSTSALTLLSHLPLPTTHLHVCGRRQCECAGDEAVRIDDLLRNRVLVHEAGDLVPEVLRRRHQKAAGHDEDERGAVVHAEDEAVSSRLGPRREQLRLGRQWSKDPQHRAAGFDALLEEQRECQ